MATTPINQCWEVALAETAATHVRSMASDMTLLEQAAAVSAKAKFDQLYEGSDGKEALLQEFLTKQWNAHKPKFFEDAKTPNQDPAYWWSFELPKDLPFDEDDINTTMTTHLDDFKGLKSGLVVVKNPGTERNFKVYISYEAEHKKLFNELVEQRKAKRRA